jgi:hypothetical protein
VTQTLTISGKPFTVEPRYSEGHTLTANEASALNQTFFENLRNNFANKAKDGGTQEEFDAYSANYQFGVRTGGGGGSRDPIEVEAMSLARDAVRKGILAAGKKVGDYSAKAISEAASKLLDKNPVYREKAAERVAQMQEVAGESIDPSILEALASGAVAEGEEAPAADADEAASGGSRKRKAAAE